MGFPEMTKRPDEVFAETPSEAAGHDLWVFGYGSLMWNPGFPYIDHRPALLKGWHRSFCLWSTRYRGTPQKPGLVLGLDCGGACRGVAFRVAASESDWTLAYLAERELTGYAYEPRMLRVEMDGANDAAPEEIQAYTFVADRAHPLYAGPLSMDRAASIIMAAQGDAGLNRDYLINTLRQLEKHGFTDKSLHELLVEVERQTGLIEQGAGI